VRSEGRNQDKQKPVTGNVSQSRFPGPASLKYRITLIMKGFCMGTADVIPGVSGGTMAFILGIYRDLIVAIKSFDLIWLKSFTSLDLKTILTRPHLGFLIPLFAGIAMALLFFTRIIPLPELLLAYPEQIYGLFFGLISGSIVVLIRNIRDRSISDLFMVVAGLVPGLIIFNLVPVSTPDAPWFIFISGVIAVCAMILPGISGSFILLILNKYAYIFNAIGYFKMSVLIPFALGLVTGLVIFSRVLAWLLERYFRGSILFITGLLLASLWVIWPFQDRVYETVNGGLKLVTSTPVMPGEFGITFYLSTLLVLAGLLVVIIMDNVVARKRSGVIEAD